MIYYVKKYKTLDNKLNVAFFLKLVTDTSVERTMQIYDDSLIDLLCDFISTDTNESLNENVIEVISNFCQCPSEKISSTIIESSFIVMCLKYLSLFNKYPKLALHSKILFLMSNLTTPPYEMPSNISEQNITSLNTRGFYDIIRCIYEEDDSKTVFSIKTEISFVYVNTMNSCKSLLFQQIFTRGLVRRLAHFCLLESRNGKLISKFLYALHAKLEAGNHQHCATALAAFCRFSHNFTNVFLYCM